MNNLFYLEYPELTQQLVPGSYSFDVETVTTGSGLEADWKCENNHIYRRSVRHRVYGRGCPVCFKRDRMTIAKTHPHLVSFFVDKEVPLEETFGSRKVVSFRCEKNHFFNKTISDFVKNKERCPDCFKAKVDKLIEHPEIIQRIDTSKSDPNLYLQLSVKNKTEKIWWKCDLGHSYESVLKSQYLGRGCHYCSGFKVLPGFNDLATTHPHIAREWADGSLQSNEITYASDKKIMWRCNEGHEWVVKASDRTRKSGATGCPACQASQGEKELVEWLKENLLGKSSIELRNRKLISPYELDIYLPDLNIAIEYNGLYWHSEEQGKDKNYHFQKWKKCKSVKVQLIQIWEDDWNNKKDIVKKMLLHKMHCSIDERIAARKTFASPMSKEESYNFMTRNHIQGESKATYRFCLRDKETNNIVAALTLIKQPNGLLILSRYATSQNVIGGFSKLLKYATCNIGEWNIIRTYADRTISDGNLYIKNGFVETKILKPDYKYIVKNRRVHKFNYRIKSFKNNPCLRYEEGLSEKQLAKLNNLPKIWDAGKICYEIKNL